MKSQRKYDRDRESGKSMKEIAHSLGLSKSTPHVWIQEYKTHEEDSFPGSGKLKLCNEELYRVKKQLAEVTMERDILKKDNCHLLKMKMLKSGDKGLYFESGKKGGKIIFH